MVAGSERKESKPFCSLARREGKALSAREPAWALCSYLGTGELVTAYQEAAEPVSKTVAETVPAPDTLNSSPLEPKMNLHSLN